MHAVDPRGPPDCRRRGTAGVPSLHPKAAQSTACDFGGGLQQRHSGVATALPDEPNARKFSHSGRGNPGGAVFLEEAAGQRRDPTLLATSRPRRLENGGGSRHHAVPHCDCCWRPRAQAHRRLRRQRRDGPRDVAWAGHRVADHHAAPGRHIPATQSARFPYLWVGFLAIAVVAISAADRRVRRCGGNGRSPA